MADRASMSGADALTEATGDARYDGLGEVVKASITYKEWQWLSDAEKARYILSLTEPDVYEDGI